MVAEYHYTTGIVRYVDLLGGWSGLHYWVMSQVSILQEISRMQWTLLEIHSFVAAVVFILCRNGV